jgi:hypothetical protein
MQTIELISPTEEDPAAKKPADLGRRPEGIIERGNHHKVKRHNEQGRRVGQALARQMRECQAKT